MFVVPEVDDDAEASTPTEAKKPIAEPEAIQQSLSSSTPSTLPPSPAPPAPVASSAKPSTATTTAESIPIKASSIPPIMPTKQHRSRRSLFHRNTIHVCDQIVERV